MAHYITDAEGKLHKIAGNFNPSYEVNQLVAEQTVTTATQNIIIENLDIIRDGGVYDFVLEGCNSTTQDSVIYIRFNEKENTRYFGSLIANGSSTPYGGTDNSVSQARVGVFAQNPSLVTGTISLPMGCPVFNSTSFDVQSNIQLVLYGGGYYDNQSNITSVRFNNATTFAVGTKVKIYKRMANATVSNSSGVNIETIYDMSSNDSSINWGYTSGIQGGVTVTGKDFSKYKKLVLSVRCAYSSFTYIISLENVNALMPNDLAGYSYSGSGQGQGAVTNNHLGISTTFISTDKTKLYHKFIGRYFIGSTNAYVESDNSSSYCITNIDGVK